MATYHTHQHTNAQTQVKKRERRKSESKERTSCSAGASRGNDAALKSTSAAVGSLKMPASNDQSAEHDKPTAAPKRAACKLPRGKLVPIESATVPLAYATHTSCMASAASRNVASASANTAVASSSSGGYEYGMPSGGKLCNVGRSIAHGRRRSWKPWCLMRKRVQSRAHTAEVDPVLVPANIR